jgi:hypothetical protein
MAKKRTPVMPTLLQVMADNQDLHVPDTDPLTLIPEENTVVEGGFIDPPTPASRGSVQPPLPEAICALLILTNSRIQWNWNFWIIKLRNGTKCHIHATASFDEWRSAIISKADFQP